MALCIKTLRQPVQLIVFSKRSIMTSTSRLEKAMEKLQKNPYYEKYAERIASLQRTSPEEFLQKLEHQNQERKSKKFGSVDTRQYSSVLNPKKAKESDNVTIEEKKLDKIFKIELVKDKQASEIQSIWEEYHKNKDVISATVPAVLYDVVLERVHLYPTFLFPLPREQGYEFFLCQSIGHELHFTPLLAFQVHKENAPECLTIVHYPELREKGIILMRGEYDKNVLSGKEARCLANQFQIYYSGKDSTKTQLLHNFNNGSENFKHTDLISQLENITLS